MALHSRIDARYDIGEILGQGGMGIVYKAYDTQRRGYVALKTMKDAADPAALDLFAQEWTTLANICHPNIVDVFNSGEFEEQGCRKPYFVMPLLPGKTLDKLIRDAGHRLTVERVVDILVQTCRGLQAAHDSGLIHRDLKPSNLFVMNDDSVKIIDFGMVHLADMAKSATGIKGTLQYMAPEQLDMKEVTPATDIFSLGVVAYEALTGRKPFDRGSQAATAEAIRSEFPPAISQLNPMVNGVLNQVIAKAMAKGPWNRFATAREFGEQLQRAAKGEAIEEFSRARIEPRIERAERALREGDFDFATEILNELQLEGRVDPDITRLLEDVKRATREKAVRQLLDSARMRLREEEFALSWQKVHEALQKDPTCVEAQSLQAEIETRRSDQQVDQWRRLVSQHVHNCAFSQALQAIEEIRKIKRDDPEVTELLAQVDRREQEFRKACAEKEKQYQSAMRAYDSGEISTALSKLEKILELEASTPVFVVPGRDQVYRETYNRVRSEWEAVQHAIAEVERVISAGNLARAAEIAQEQSTKYPNDFALQALRLKVEDLLRQEKSSYLADVSRRIDLEPDLDRAVRQLEEALQRYPTEPHLQELANNLRKRRDLVNSIVLKARQYEEQNLIAEALGQWNTLRSIHPRFPGLDLEFERVQNRDEQQRREEAKLSWVNQVDRLLQTGDYDRAHDLAVQALSQFPGDQELLGLDRLARERRECSIEAKKLMERATDLCSTRQFAGAIDLLRQAFELDPNNAAIRTALANALAGQAQGIVAKEWRTAEPLIQEALRIDPGNVLAKSVRPSVLLAERIECVDECIAGARERQAAGDFTAALAKVQEGLTPYPNDIRLLQLQSTLRSTISEQAHLRRRTDLEELRQLSVEVEQARDQTSWSALLERSVVLSQRYRDDEEFSKIARKIHDHATKTSPDPGPDRPTETVRLDAPASGPSNRDAVTPRHSHLESAAQFAGAFYKRAAGRVTFMRAASMRLRTFARSLPERLSPISRGAYLSASHRIAPAALALLTTGMVFVQRGDSGKPKPPSPPSSGRQVPVKFTGALEGAAISIDGRLLTGDSLNLEPGLHKIRAVKQGYKTDTRDITVKSDPATVNLRFEAEPQIIRVSADLPSAVVLIDGQQVGVLQENNFACDLSGSGAHTLQLMQGKTEVLSVQFEAGVGSPARILSHRVVPDIPLVLVSNLGPHTIVQSSITGMRVNATGGDPQPIPPEGRDLMLPVGNNEVTFDDGRKPVSVPIDTGNAPVLTIRAGATNKGMLVIEANVEGAALYINGAKSSRPVRHGRWVGQLDPGEYKIRLSAAGYEEASEQTVTLHSGQTAGLKLDLKPAITVAYLRIEGGTPDAEVSVDGTQIGTLDASGALASAPVAPGLEHTIRIQKQGYEPFEARHQAAVKGTIQISAPEARLKQFGMLVLEVQPPEAQLTIKRQGGSAQTVTDQTLHLPEGTYIFNGTAEGYEHIQKQEQIVSGESRTVRIVLVRKELPPPPPPARVELNELFTDGKSWILQDTGFWVHGNGTTWLRDPHFTHVFEFQKPRKGLLKQEKIRWWIYLQGDDYLECELDDSAFYRREMAGGKLGQQQKLVHNAGTGATLRIAITVEPGRVAHSIGVVNDSLPRNVEGRTGFRGKLSMRLVR